MIKWDSDLKSSSKKEYNDDDFESDYHNESDVIEKVRDIDDLEERSDFKDESSEGVIEEKKPEKPAGVMMASNL